MAGLKLLCLGLTGTFLLGFIIAEGNAEESVNECHRIVGGVEAIPNEFPYQLRMLMKFGERTGLCGASIISENYALTAAHCVESRPDAVILQVAYHDITEKAGPEYTRGVETIYVHPEYDSSNQHNDIALIKLSEPFIISNVSSPIKLADSSYGTELNGTAIATGWGTTSSGGKPSKVLMKVEVELLPNRNCRFVYPNYDPMTMVCAGFVRGGKDTCQGDSGGPLAQDGVQVGVVSFGAGCAWPFFPGVYTRVSAFNQWIQDTMAGVGDGMKLA